MNNFIALETLVEPRLVDRIADLEQMLPIISQVKVRQQLISFVTQTKRQLWQAYGLEYIEPELLSYLDSLPADAVFYDIGASTGLFSLYAASLGLRVWAFEPDAQNYALLEHNHYLNRTNLKGSIDSLNIAIAEENKISTLYIAKYEPAGHMKILNTPKKVQELEKFTPDHQQRIITYSIDDLIITLNLPVPNYLKIDVDGSELDVINGAEITLRSSELKSLFIELDELSAKTPIIKEKLMNAGFSFSERYQVQNYENLYNYIYRK